MRMTGLYVFALVLFLAIDGLWLGVIARGFFVEQMGPLLRPDPNLAIAALFYVFYVIGLMYFAVVPGLREGSLVLALLNGAFIGFLAYGTYDITNLAVLNGYTAKLAVVDITWGTVLSGFVSAATFQLARVLGMAT